MAVPDTAYSTETSDGEEALRSTCTVALLTLSAPLLLIELKETVGRPSTSTALVAPTLLRVTESVLPAASLISPSSREKLSTAIPSVSSSPDCTTYLNTKEEVPSPL